MPRVDHEAIQAEWDDVPARRTAPQRRRDRGDEHPVGRVVRLHRGFLDVLLDGRELQAVYGGAMRGEQVVVGDRVRVRPPRRETDTARVVDRLERETVLLRTGDDALGDERLVAANVDQAVAVVTAGEGDVGTRIIDRILVAAEAGRLRGAVCINKVDLGSDVAEVAARYERLGYPVVRTSALTGEGVDDLRALLPGTWSVLAGHSGVGKTSLTNRLIPDHGGDVAAIGRFGGRHTTVSPHALEVPDVEDAWLVDTPGIRSFGIGHLAPEDLAWTFPELRDPDCELPGCLHDGEPGCAVPALVGERIDPARYDSYQRFLSVLRDGRDAW